MGENDFRSIAETHRLFFRLLIECKVTYDSIAMSFWTCFLFVVDSESSALEYSVSLCRSSWSIVVGLFKEQPLGKTEGNFITLHRRLRDTDTPSRDRSIFPKRPENALERLKTPDVISAITPNLMEEIQSQRFSATDSRVAIPSHRFPSDDSAALDSSEFEPLEGVNRGKLFPRNRESAIGLRTPGSETLPVAESPRTLGSPTLVEIDATRKNRVDAV